MSDISDTPVTQYLYYPWNAFEKSWHGNEDGGQHKLGTMAKSKEEHKLDMVVNFKEEYKLEATKKP